MALKVNTETFLKRAYLKHGDLYDYSLVVYKKSTEKVKIICKKHGVFEQTPQCHMRGGCKKCSFAKMGANKKIDLDKFIKISRLKHGNRYDYSKVSISSTSDTVDIVCKKHGVFKQIANNHMRRSGCYKCNVTEVIDNDSFKDCARKIHGGRYDYSNVSFSGVKNRVNISCKKHGEFSQIINVHLRGSGCPDCAKTTSFKRNSYVESCKKHKGISMIYLIKCFNENEVFYKIGITCRGVSSRFYGLIPYQYDVICVIKGAAGLVWDCEKKLFSFFKKYSYKPLLNFAGSTECFSEVDIDKFYTIVDGVLGNVRKS